MHKETKKIENWWEGNSKNYQSKYKLPIEIHYGPGVPNEDKLKLIGSVKGKKVLELGCGGAQCSIAFAKKGAKVTGMDISEEQLNFAEKIAKKNKINIDLLQGDFMNLKKIRKNSQDIVFSAWAFHYASNLDKLFREVRRVLKKGGLFVFSMPHPFHTCINSKTLKVKRSYFKTGKLIDGTFMCYEVMVSDIFNSLKKNDLEIDEMLEPFSGGKNRWRGPKYPKKRIKNIPSTIIFKTRKT